MAEGVRSEEEKAAEARRGPRSSGPTRGPMSLGRPGETSMDFGPSARRVLQRLRPYRLRVALVVALGIVSVALSAVGPRVLGRATDLVFAGAIGQDMPAGATRDQVIASARDAGNDRFADLLGGIAFTPGQGIDFAAIGRVLLLVLAIYVVASALHGLQGWILARVIQDTMYRLRQEVEEKLHRLPLAHVDGQPRGELLSRVTNDLDNVGQSLQQTFSQLLTSLMTVLFVLGMMFWISWVLALAALVAVPLSILVTRAIAGRSQALLVQQWRSTGQLNAIVEEAYTAHSLVKVFGRQQEVRDTFEATNGELYDASYGAQFISGIIMPSMMFIGNLSYVAVAVIGGLRVASGQVSLGEVQAFIQYSRQFTQPLTQVASMANVLQSGVASAERVFEVLDAPEQDPDTATPVVIEDPSGEVVFDDVSFAYRAEEPLLEQVNLEVRPGQMVAIVGETGAGKTTLVNLVMRFYELDAGRITLDGVDITDMTRDGLRSRIGMVLQDAWLFEGTIRDNIAYGRPDASDDDIRAAARAARVDHFVHNLPDGYDTVLADEASNISVGERQLITIARAFLSEPSLLILDEATSSVDTRTELLVQQAMADLRSDRTSFVIAHRLSTIREADLILVMAHGRIVEQGTHAELLAAEGAYADLYAAQFSGAAHLPDVVAVAGAPGAGPPPRPGA